MPVKLCPGVNYQEGWGSCADAEHSPPLGKPGALLIVLGTPLAQVVEALHNIVYCNLTL